MLKRAAIFLLCINLLAFTGCRKEEALGVRVSGFETFIPKYNKNIKNWLEDQAQVNAKSIATAQQELQSAAASKARQPIKKRIAALKREQEKLSFRLSLGDYFRFADLDEIPTDLKWEDGMEQEEIGDARAKKGGTFRVDIRSFPPTIRPFGDNSNNSFRGNLYDNIDLPLVGLHPKTMQMIPGLAKQWAVSADGRTVYFRLNEKATYSDGVPVVARDFLYASYIRISDDIVNPFSKQFYRDNLAAVWVYDEHTLSVSLPEAQIYAPAVVGSFSPSPPHFYKDYGPDYNERFQWKFPPTTGAYEVKEGDVVKGVSITQTRVKNWWAKDLKYYKYRFNTDRIVHTVVRDESKAFELFRAGQLDSFYVERPDLWYEKSEMEPVFDGYIERYTFYNQWPALPRGLYLNVSMPLLDELDIRIGIQHAMNWQKVNDVLFRGDFRRLDAFNQGYLLFSDPTIKARPFSVTAARAAFRKAGFTETGRDGILRRKDGTQLSISVSYSANPIVDRMFAILREDAKNCGFDLRLDSLEPTVSYRKVMQKQHEMAFSGWLVSPSTPEFYQFFHSTNARDERGNLKPQTNNLCVWGRGDTDALAEQVRFAITIEEMREATFKLQRIIHDEAIFVPAYTSEFSRIASWRWLRWPDSEATRFCPPVTYAPLEAFVHWIDEDVKAETMDARRAGKTFPEVNRIFDDYRDSKPVEGKPETEEAPQ